MKNPMLASTFALIAFFASSATHAADEVKIGFVDLQRALNEVEEGATAKAKLKAEFDMKQRALDEKQNKLKAMKEELDQKGMMMNADKKAEMQATMQRDLMEVQQLYFQMQQELTKRESEATGTIFQKMGVILQSMGREESYTMIVEKSSVLYAKNHLDLTNELIRRYNKSYPLKKKKRGK